MELEGIVSKRNESLYRSGRNKTSEIEPVIAEQARDQNGGLNFRPGARASAPATDLRTYLVGQIISLVVVAMAIPTASQGLRLVVFRDGPCRTTTRLP